MKDEGRRRNHAAGVAFAFSPLPGLVWIFFLIWTAIGAVVMPLGIGQSQIESWIGQPDLRAAALAILHGSDAFWIVLAAINVYFATAMHEGLNVTRRWASIILVGSAMCEWVGARTGFPFGPYRYTDNFGWRLGGVLPFTIPLAWLVILLSGRRLVLVVRPEVTRLGLALGTGLVALATDLNLEPVAWKIRAYWVWYPGREAAPSGWPPVQNYVSWFAIACLLTYALPPNYALRPPSRIANRPVAVLVLMNVLFLLVNGAHWAGAR